MSKELNLKYCTAEELADWIIETEKDGFKEFTISGVLDDRQVQTVMKAYRIVGYTEGIAKSTEVLMQMPDISRKGRWVQKYPDKSIYYCSECNFPDNQWYVIRSNYCGHCGAKMEGDGK